VVDLDDLQKKLKAIADTVNLFKSEAVQLRVVDALLNELGSWQGSTTVKAGAAVELPRRSRRRRKNAAATPKESKTKAARTSPRKSTSPGAFAMINELLSNGFFKTPRTISSIVEHCRSARGHHYKANECSPGLLRLLRDEKLKRQKNKDGQYEYTQA
jgi:hypothetical protein